MRFTEASGDLLQEWAEFASDEDKHHVGDVLVAALDGSVRQKFEAYEDQTRRGQLLVEVAPHLVVVLRYYREYRDRVSLVYIGDPDGSGHGAPVW